MRREITQFEWFLLLERLAPMPWWEKDQLATSSRSLAAKEVAPEVKF